MPFTFRCIKLVNARIQTACTDNKCNCHFFLPSSLRATLQSRHTKGTLRSPGNRDTPDRRLMDIHHIFAFLPSCIECNPPRGRLDRIRCPHSEGNAPSSFIFPPAWILFIRLRYCFAASIAASLTHSAIEAITRPQQILTFAATGHLLDRRHGLREAVVPLGYGVCGDDLFADHTDVLVHWMSAYTQPIPCIRPKRC